MSVIVRDNAIFHSGEVPPKAAPKRARPLLRLICWERVAQLLRREGHRVFTPTLTGLAERAHLMSRDLTLDTHIRDVVEVFEREHLQNAILVGHSFGGWVVSGAIEELRNSVAALVFVDAHIPHDGQMPRVTSHHRDDIDLALREGRASTPPRKDAAAWFCVNETDRPTS